jgi:hypothetical protein
MQLECNVQPHATTRDASLFLCCCPARSQAVTLLSDHGQRAVLIVFCRPVLNEYGPCASQPWSSGSTAYQQVATARVSRLRRWALLCSPIVV